MVGFEDQAIDRAISRQLSDIERLRGPLRITVRKTADGLGVSIPPPRNLFMTGFLCLWLAGWAAGEMFALRTLLAGGLGPSLFLIIWLIPWTLGGAGVLWVVLWQLFGREQLFFTSGALVREWSLLGFRRRRVVMGETITSIKAETGNNDLAGLGAIKVKTSGKTMRIGAGLTDYEAELIADLIRSVGKLPSDVREDVPETDEDHG